MIYLDTSVVVPVVLVEAASPRIDAWLAADPDICVSRWTVSEVSSALSHHLRTGRIDAEEREAAEAALDHWVSGGVRVVEIEEEDIAALRALLRSDPLLRTPDALHLAVVMRLDCALATHDVRLAGSARDIEIEVIVP